MKNTLWIAGIVVIIAVLLLTACGGKEKTSAPAGPVVESSSDTTTEKSNETSAETDEPTQPVEPTATPEPQDRFPDILVIHPDAFNFEVTEATHTYVYVIPLMVADAVAYLEPEFKAKGWEELGKPTIMGHLATLNLKREGYRLTVSLQDNELSKTTRVQMLLMEQ